MNFTPMHKVELAHSWKEIDRIRSETGSWTTVEQCQDCGERHEVLHLGRDSGPSFKDSPQTEVLDSWRRISESWQRVARSMNEMFERLVDDTAYESTDEIFDDIYNRSQRVVDGGNLPYWQLQRWLCKPKRYRVINLLPFFQGPVCNRCDRLFSLLVEPTVDHINGDRSNGHPSNLQLLCKDCNGKKGDGPPDERDVSPYTYEGEVCEHKLTCVEFHDLQSAKEGAPVED